MMHRCLSLFIALLLCIVPIFAHAEAVVPEKNASLRLLDELYEGQNTLVFSPMSLSIALSMTKDGAAGKTASQLNEFLSDSCPPWYVLEELSFSSVHQANAAFLRPEFNITSEYKDALVNRYAAMTQSMNAQDVAGQINDWVYDHTDGLIENFMTEEPDPNVQLILVNALAMQADWQHPFDPANTSSALFHAPEGDIEVSSMNQTESFAYTEADGVQSVALPYKLGEHFLSSSLEMIVLMPEDGNLQPLVDELSASPDAFLEKYLPTENALVQLTLPVTRAESSFELIDALAAHGVTDAFDPDLADFSVMSPQADELDLHIGSVLQSAAISVTESGTEAAAATRVEMKADGAMPSEIVRMNVDRPYMMLIHAPDSGYVLFAVCINNPA